MFKNHVVVWVLATFVAVIFQFGQAEAADHYMGKYADGKSAYLDTTSIRVTNHYNNGYHSGDTYTFDVKAVIPNSDKYDVIHYEMYCGQTVCIKKNGVKIWQTFHRGEPNFFETHPVEKNLMDYFEELHKQEWKKVPEQIY